jgi:methylmalonyl-CoA/ethylmalonyl-CoA epimerase
VRDLEAAMRTYVHDYGIGPWDIYEFNPGNVKDLREYGQPVDAPGA